MVQRCWCVLVVRYILCLTACTGTFKRLRVEMDNVDQLATLQNSALKHLILVICILSVVLCSRGVGSRRTFWVLLTLNTIELASKLISTYQKKSRAPPEHLTHFPLLTFGYFTLHTKSRHHMKAGTAPISVMCCSLLHG